MTFIARQYTVSGSTIARCVIVGIMSLGGCSTSPAWRQSDWNEPKIVLIRKELSALAEHSIQFEDRWRGTPKEISYLVSLDPKVSNGFAETIEGSENLWDPRISGNISIICAKETIREVDTAVIYESILCHDDTMQVGAYLFIWKNGRWISDREYVLQLLQRFDPSIADQVKTNTGKYRQFLSTRPFSASQD